MCHLPLSARALKRRTYKGADSAKPRVTAHAEARHPHIVTASIGAILMADPFADMDDGRFLAQAIVNTLREPLLVLDKNLRVIAASRSFYLTFKVERQDVQGRPVYALGNGQWDIPELRILLEEILPRDTAIEAYEVEQDFGAIGRRTMLLNARAVFNENNAHTRILLAIEDITERRAAEQEMAELLQQKDILLQEMQHRVANSLQIIASILLIKARTVQSEETRQHLQDAHQRVMSVAAIQQQLRASRHGEAIKLAPYLSRLCETLAASMIGEGRSIEIKVQVEHGTASSNEAVSIGLIVTELVINALKHAFIDNRANGVVDVSYEVAETSWRLTVADNGIGRAEGDSAKLMPGLGTSIVEALAKQLDADVHISMVPQGTSVSITHGTMPLPLTSASRASESAAA
jgi:two-component sensor histidine kinase